MQTIVTKTPFRPVVSAGLAILCLLGSATTARAIEVGQQIRAAVQNYAVSKLAADEVRLGQLDARLRLTSCRTPLNVFLPKGAQQVGKSTLGIRCEDKPGWKVYIPVHLKRFAMVVISQQTLPKGTVIGQDDIKLRKMDLSQLRYGHFRTRDEVLGMQLKRSVRSGEPLSPVNLKPRRMVLRGDIITILAEVQGLTVRVKGHALADGYRGEAIRVKNQRSKRILQAEVIAPGIVRVRL